MPQAIERAGKWYVLAVTAVTRVWRERPGLLAPTEQTGGRPRRTVRLAPGAKKAETVAHVIAPLPPQRWRRLSVGGGAKGPRVYDWTRLRVIERRDDLPGPDVWLLARRSVSHPDEVAYFLAGAPARSPCSAWPRWPAPGTSSSRASRKPRARPASTATRSARGRVGIATSP
ncbi:MAG TPA: hypothetical protein VGP82_21270 [Ktedonobacterales bacterium]|nr:hypothetical protein [Ktedonobacterales bacterium]